MNTSWRLGWGRFRRPETLRLACRRSGPSLPRERAGGPQNRREPGSKDGEGSPAAFQVPSADTCFFAAPDSGVTLSSRRPPAVRDPRIRAAATRVLRHGARPSTGTTHSQIAPAPAKARRRLGPASGTSAASERARRAPSSPLKFPLFRAWAPSPTRVLAAVARVG
jgi:hypothetical protein